MSEMPDTFWYALGAASGLCILLGLVCVFGPEIEHRRSRRRHGGWLR